MASELEKKPKKGILKTSSSFDTDGHIDVPSVKQAKWDEMNILATHHPPDKDYGHMKINEPPTPYSTMEGMDLEDDEVGEKQMVDPEHLASKLEGSSGRKVFEGEEDASSDEDLPETEEDRAHRKEFEQKRKLHYNEFQAVKLARQLLEEEEDEEEEGEKKPQSSSENPDGETL